MKNSIILGFIGLLGLMMSCGGSGNSGSSASSTAGTKDFSGYSITDYKGGNGYKLAKAHHPKDGFITSEGPLKNNMREGTWMTYHTGRDTGKIKTVTNYHNDVKTGVALEFATNGSLAKRVDYDNDVIHGVYAEYKYNRPLKYAEYQEGKLNGVYKTFYSNGKLQQKSNYRNDKKNGKSLFYNEEEQLIMEYEYKNGEKVSGGKVTPPPIEEKK